MLWSAREIQPLNAVFFLELVYATAGIDKLLLPCEVRMAVGANFYTEVLLNGTRFERIAACAGHRSYVVIRMNSLFHFIHLSPPWSLCGSRVI
jgi:hypothetical protein